MGINRRSFLAGAAVASTFPLANVQAKALKDIKHFDKETDVLVIGYGGAGACAAIEAHDNGANVLIIEKLSVGGGNTAVSAGGFMIPTDAKKAYDYLASTFTLANSEMDPELVKEFCKEIPAAKPFLEGLKPDTKIWVYGHAGFPRLPNADVIDKCRLKGKGSGGIVLFNLYRHAVESVRKIPILFNTPATRLIRDGETIVGAVAQHQGKTIHIKARKGVILATGGYEYDASGLHAFALGRDILSLGSPGNTGDGLRMAQAVGARLWHMSAFSCPLGMKVPGLKAALRFNAMGPGYIWVDQDGKRFVNEKGIDIHTCLYAVNHLDPVKNRYPRIPCYAILDDETIKTGPICGGRSSGYGFFGENYKWSDDNSKEIESGIIIKADSIAELANKLNIPGTALQTTVERWNKDIRNGSDSLFNRAITRLPKNKNTAAHVISAPLETGPVYGVPLYPALFNTQGGPKKNANAQVLNAFNEVIPRLYVVGELGSIWGDIYQGATNNAESIVFGRIAGRHAAGLKTWS